MLFKVFHFDNEYLLDSPGVYDFESGNTDTFELVVAASADLTIATVLAEGSDG